MRITRIQITEMEAYKFRARLEAGLQLCGRDEDGDYMWMGTKAQWDRVDLIEVYFEMI